MAWLIDAPRISPPTRATLLRGILAFRLLVGAWMTVVFLWEIWDRGNTDRPDVAHPGVGIGLLVVALLIAGWLTVRYGRDADNLVQPVPVAAEIVIAAILLFLDTWVYGAQHSQALPTVWPIAVIFTVAVAAGSRAAILTGVGLGLARYLGWAVFPYPDNDTFFSLARIASTVLFAVAGGVAGYLLTQQERSDREISTFRAREEVARTLHDGVLQTLAIIQRRSEDDELVSLARTQEHELREYLFGATTVEDDIGSALRASARRAEQRYGLSVQVICAPDLPPGDDHAIHALGSAVGEALTNAAKHGGADKVTVYAEPGEPTGVFVSVKDDGSGFDTSATTEGEGLSRSIRGRLTELGGRVEVDGRLGRGAEIRMWL